MKHETLASGIALFLVGSATAALSLQMRIGIFHAAGSGLFPLCLGLLLMGLSASWILQSLWHARMVKSAPESAGAAGDQALIVKAAHEACVWANDRMKDGELKYLIELERKGIQVVIPDAESFRQKGKPAVEQLFRTEWPVTTWAEVLAQ